MEFRDATRGDLPAIARLLADDVLGAGREQPAPPLADAYLSAFDEIERQPGNRVIVAVDQAGAIRGCLQLTVVPGLAQLGLKRATIEGVRIDRTARGSGLGSRMLQHAIEAARREGCGLVQLTTDHRRQDARRFYEKLGFVDSHAGMKLHL